MIMMMIMLVLMSGFEVLRFEVFLSRLRIV